LVAVLVLVPLTMTVTPFSGRSLGPVTLPLMTTCVAGPMEVSSMNAITDTIVFMIFAFKVSVIRMQLMGEFHKRG